jgi:hypothetical protein
MQLKSRIPAIVFTIFILASCNSKAHQDDLRGVLNAEPCVEHSVSLVAFAHVSPHGMWISEDPGTNGEGIIILLKDADMGDVGIERLLRYSKDYSQQKSFAFKATFNGVLSCEAGGKRGRLSVTGIDEVTLVELRDTQTEM